MSVWPATRRLRSYGSFCLVRTWFPDGLDDPPLTLIPLDAATGAFWESPGGAWQVAAAFATSLVTGKPGKSGRSGTLSFE